MCFWLIGLPEAVMHERADGGLPGGVPTSHSSSGTRHWVAVSLASSGAAIILVFYGLLQLDLPAVRYLRTFTTHRAGEQLTVPWMAWTSDAGDWIGEGFHLIAVSAILLILGWSLSRSILQRAGIETLLAHGLAALLSNGLKHLLGRPRPKFVHSGEWQFTPSWASGLDSFPSGHTTASFAVAAVLAKRFPTFGPLCFGIAAFVGLSRVIRGSHFPTDVFGGAILGILSGSLASAPWKEWRASLEEGLRFAAFGTAACFAVLWTVARHADDGVPGSILIAAGLAALVVGLWLRCAHWIHWIHWMRREAPAIARQEKASPLLITYGLACMTTSPLIMAVVGFVCLAYWVQPRHETFDCEQQLLGRSVLTESALVASLLLALTVLFQGRGVLPLH